MYSTVTPSGDTIDTDTVELHSNIIVSDSCYEREKRSIESQFLQLSPTVQTEVVQRLLQHMSHCQHGQIDSFLKPMLQRDFITDLPAKGLFQVSEQILIYLDAKSLCAASQVSRCWRQVIREGFLWKKLIEQQVMTDGLWRGLGERMGWIGKLRIPGQHIHPKATQYNNSNNNNGGGRVFKTSLSGLSESSGVKMLLSPGDSASIACGGGGGTNSNNIESYMMNMSPGGNTAGSAGGVTAEYLDCDNAIISGYELMDPDYYQQLYPEIIVNIKRIQKHWLNGKYTLKKIECHSESSKGVYCLQYDDKKIVSGLRDNSIKVWDARTLECVRILTGHVGSVLCLQYDDNVIISGSSDSTVRVWSLGSWTCVNTIYHHCEAVLHLRFAHSILVTCSKDRSIAVWDMFAPNDIRLRRVLVGHRAAVNVVDFDQKNIVSASGDRTIKVWNTQTCEFLHTMNGHRRGIACLQYRNNLVVSGSSDNTIRLWQIETGTCLRTLEGHEELVRCIRFDNKYIVSGAYDGKIKVWDLVAALNPQSPSNILCLQTLNQHTGRVFRLQFDEFQIVSSSHDDTILIWDFLDTTASQEVDMSVLRSPVVSIDNEDDLIHDSAMLNHPSMSQTLDYDSHDYNHYHNNNNINSSSMSSSSMTIAAAGGAGAASASQHDISSSNATRAGFHNNSKKSRRTPPSNATTDARGGGVGGCQSNDSSSCLNDSANNKTTSSSTMMMMMMRSTTPFDNFLYDSNQTSVHSEHEEDSLPPPQQQQQQQLDQRKSPSSSRKFS